jgi:N-methylhydantoinase A/oxoprolinase/acetone carboxylase beta subunit
MTELEDSGMDRRQSEAGAATFADPASPPAMSHPRRSPDSAPVGVVEIGVDVGGTFTDVVCRWSSGEVRLFKIPTTHGEPAAAIAAAIDRFEANWGVAPAAIRRFLHGTTIATNAAIEHKGVRVGLLTTDGFVDVFEIGRQARKDMYNLDLRASSPVFLLPGARRQGVRERIGADGSVVTPLDEESLRRALAALLREKVEAVAVCFLFSFLNPSHEERAREIILEEAPGMTVSLSSEVDPAFREYERTCVTAFDAYVKPIVRDYLTALQDQLTRAGVPVPLQVMQSRGGLTRIETACERPVRLFLSGPAGGVIGGRDVGRMCGIDDIITVDIGGTSSDIALIAGGQPILRSEGVIDGYTVRVPMVDVNAIGAGGGSIAWLDGVGGLRVGPHSAGSEPGPACYGRGGRQPTVTDASIVLGYLNPDFFAGGDLKLDASLAHRAVAEHVAAPLGMTVEQAAWGIHRVVNGQMAEGIRLVSIRRGYDPRKFALVMLGGAGAIHGTALAEELGIGRVIVPLFPGVLAAYGLLSAPVEHEMSSSVQKPLSALSMADLRAGLAALDERCARLMAPERVDPASVRIRHFADVCYVGQSYYLEIEVREDDSIERIYRDFLAEHARIYGHSVEKPAKIANLRTVHQSGGAEAGNVPTVPYRASGTALKGTRPIVLTKDGTSVPAQVWNRTALEPGRSIAGPAIIEQIDTTVVVGAGWRGTVEANGCVILVREGTNP